MFGRKRVVRFNLEPFPNPRIRSTDGLTVEYAYPDDTSTSTMTFRGTREQRMAVWRCIANAEGFEIVDAETEAT